MAKKIKKIKLSWIAMAAVAIMVISWLAGSDYFASEQGLIGAQTGFVKPPAVTGIPDLMVKEVTVERATGVDTVKVLIKNKGDERATDFKVTVSDITTGVDIVVKDISRLDPGKETSFPVNYNNPPTTYTIQATVDSEEFVKERNEANNIGLLPVS